MKYIDYGTMQSDAQRRVLEMQRRARNAVYFPHGCEDSESICSESTSRCDEEMPECGCENSDCGGFAEYPQECVQECASSPAAARACAEHKRHDFLGRIAKDPEEALLLIILVLLISEKADMLLILAIAYLLI